MTRDELIERMARAIYAATGTVRIDEGREFEPVTWEELDDDDYQCIRAGYRGQAQSALSAIEEAGLVIVPREPTEKMLRVLSERGGMIWGSQEAYDDMIEASPFVEKKDA